MFLSCSGDISVENATDYSMCINWPQPTITSISGAPLSISCCRQSGHHFAVPGSYEGVCKAEATCSFRISLKRKYIPEIHNMTYPSFHGMQRAVFRKLSIFRTEISQGKKMIVEPIKPTTLVSISNPPSSNAQQRSL